MTCQSFSSNRSSVSICERLKQRYGTSAQNWQTSFQDDIRQKNARDTEFIRYIVNFVIEQSKHSIVISELPDVIRTLHHEAAIILDSNRMITLEEAITQVQTTGALNYPYLKKVKPNSTEDFVKEVTREVLDRLGSLITLDMIENICQYTTCSTKQLLNAMPAIDVNEAVTLIAEDISRNQHEKRNHLKHIDTINTAVLQNSIKDKTFLASSSPTRMKNGIIDSKPEGMPISLNKERDSSRSTQNLNHSHERTSLITSANLPRTTKKSKSPRNKNTNQLNEPITAEQQLSNNSVVKARRLKLLQDPRSAKISSTALVLSENYVIEEYPSVKKSSLQASVKDLNNNFVKPEKDEKITLSKSRSQTQTYSYCSDEVSSVRINDDATVSIERTDVNRYLQRNQNGRLRTEIDSDSCPFETLLYQRFKQQE